MNIRLFFLLQVVQLTIPMVLLASEIVPKGKGSCCSWKKVIDNQNAELKEVERGNVILKNIKEEIEQQIKDGSKDHIAELEDISKKVKDIILCINKEQNTIFNEIEKVVNEYKGIISESVLQANDCQKKNLETFLSNLENIIKNMIKNDFVNTDMHGLTTEITNKVKEFNEKQESIKNAIDSKIEKISVNIQEKILEPYIAITELNLGGSIKDIKEKIEGLPGNVSKTFIENLNKIENQINSLKKGIEENIKNCIEKRIEDNMELLNKPVESLNESYDKFKKLLEEKERNVHSENKKNSEKHVEGIKNFGEKLILEVKIFYENIQNLIVNEKDKKSLDKMMNNLVERLTTEVNNFINNFNLLGRELDTLSKNLKSIDEKLEYLKDQIVENKGGKQDNIKKKIEIMAKETTETEKTMKNACENIKNIGLNLEYIKSTAIPQMESNLRDLTEGYGQLKENLNTTLQMNKNKIEGMDNKLTQDNTNATETYKKFEKFIEGMEKNMNEIKKNTEEQKSINKKISEKIEKRGKDLDSQKKKLEN